jgi:hypothetical protein
VEKIYTRLPAYYRTALSALETVLPRCTNSPQGIFPLYNNIALALGKCALNSPTVERLLNISNPSLEQLVDVVQADSPDLVFREIVKHLANEPRTVRSLINIVRETPIEAGFSSFEAFIESAREMSRDALGRLVFTIDQRLMGHLRTALGSAGIMSVDASRRIDLLNDLIEKWNRPFQERYGHGFAAVNKIEMHMNARPRIRTLASPVLRQNRILSLKK